MTHVYDVLQQWIDRQQIPPTQAQMARLLGVSRGTITNWKTETVPKPAQIDTIVERTGIPKQELLTAVLRDQGYLRVDTWDGGGADDAAATSQAEVSSASKVNHAPADDYRLAAQKAGPKTRANRARRREEKYQIPDEDQGEAPEGGA